MAEFSKYFSKRVTLIIFISVVIFLGLYFYSNSKTYVMDRMTNNDGSNTVNNTIIPKDEPASALKVAPDSYNNKDIADPSSLLPKDMNSEWAKLNPVNTDKIIGSDLLDSAAFMGQVSQYKGIMNHDLRAWPVIPKKTVSPWLQSEYEPDAYQIGIKCAE